jgi:hypothetical protein
MFLDRCIVCNLKEKFNHEDDGTLNCARCGQYTPTREYLKNPLNLGVGGRYQWQQLSAAIRQKDIVSLDYPHPPEWDSILTGHKPEDKKCKLKLMRYLKETATPDVFIPLEYKFDFTLFDMASGEHLRLTLDELQASGLVEQKPSDLVGDPEVHFRLTTAGRIHPTV